MHKRPREGLPREGLGVCRHWRIGHCTYFNQGGHQACKYDAHPVDFLWPNICHRSQRGCCSWPDCKRIHLGTDVGQHIVELVEEWNSKCMKPPILYYRRSGDRRASDSHDSGDREHRNPSPADSRIAVEDEHGTPSDVLRYILDKCNSSLEWKSAIFRAAEELGSGGSQNSTSDNTGLRDDPEVLEMLQWWRQHKHAIEQAIPDAPSDTDPADIK